MDNSVCSGVNSEIHQMRYLDYETQTFQISRGIQADQSPAREGGGSNNEISPKERIGMEVS